MLTDDRQAQWSITAPIIYATTFNAIEALDL
jgi:hypothetical protein